eukprot:scaffold266685_cov23-Tisochrysis_lutea.AAC.1
MASVRVYLSSKALPAPIRAYLKLNLPDDSPFISPKRQWKVRQTLNRSCAPITLSIPALAASRMAPG